MSDKRAISSGPLARLSASMARYRRVSLHSGPWPACACHGFFPFAGKTLDRIMRAMRTSPGDGPNDPLDATTTKTARPALAKSASRAAEGEL